MSSSEIRELVINCIEELFEIEDLSNEKDLLNEELDSIIFIRLVIELEDTFEIEIDDSDLIIEQFLSLDSICSLIQRYVNNGE